MKRAKCDVLAFDIIELCDECNNCTKFQFYAEKVVRDIDFCFILHHFVSTL